MDIELARLALKGIETDPEHWYQAAYRCGTTCCYAGFVALAAGATWANEHSPLVRTPEGTVERVEQYAQRALRATLMQAMELFGGANTKEDIARLIDDFAGPEQQR